MRLATAVILALALGLVAPAAAQDSGQLVILVAGRDARDADAGALFRELERLRDDLGFNPAEMPLVRMQFGADGGALNRAGFTSGLAPAVGVVRWGSLGPEQIVEGAIRTSVAAGSAIGAAQSIVDRWMGLTGRTSSRDLALLQPAVPGPDRVQGPSYQGPSYQGPSYQSGAAEQLIPAEASTLYTLRPVVGATFSGSAAGARLMVDGRDFTHEARVDGSALTWTPSYDLSAGSHMVALQAGGTTREWGFVLTPEAPGRALTSVQALPRGVLQTGARLVVSAQGLPYGRATMDVGGRRGLPMREIAPGVYRGEYGVAADDRTSALVVVYLVLPDGRSDRREGPERVLLNVTQ